MGLECLSPRIVPELGYSHEVASAVNLLNLVKGIFGRPFHWKAILSFLA